MTTYELRDPCPVELRHQIAAIVSGARMSTRILIECSHDHGEHVAVVRVGGNCPPCSGDCEQGRKCPAKQDRELSDLADAYLGKM